MLGDLGDASIVYMLIIFIIGNVLVCLFLINRLFEQKKINDRLRSNLNEMPDKSLKKYFQEQFEKTRIKKNTDNNELNLTHDAANLRLAYLRIESKAIDSPINSEAYWQYLAVNIDKLFRIISPLKAVKNTKKDELLNKVEIIKSKFDTLAKKCKDKNVSEIREKISKNMDVVYGKIKSSDLSANQIKKYYDKINALSDAFEKSAIRQPYLKQKSKEDHKNKKSSALDKIAEYCEDNSATVNFAKAIESSNAEIIEKLNEYEKENNSLTRYVKQLKKQLEESHIGELEREAEGSAKNNELESDLNEEIIASNEKEISRLRDVVKSQRNAILDLEEMTANSKDMDKEDFKQYKVEIEQLKRSALDSEMCVKVLEEELDSLRESLRQPSSKENEVSAYEIEQLNKELGTLKDELLKTEEKNHQYSSLLQFVFDALSASSIEDVSLLLHESLSNLNFSPLILVKAKDRIIELFENDTLSVREKTIISNMQLNEINPQKDGKLIFRLDYITGLIKPTAHQSDAGGMHDHVIQILKLSNNVIKQILQTQRNREGVKKADSYLGDIKKSSFEVDEILDRFIKNTKLIVEDSFTQIKSTARAKGLDVKQIAAFQAIEKDALSQMQAEDTIRPKIRKKFLGIINTIEK